MTGNDSYVVSVGVQRRERICEELRGRRPFLTKVTSPQPIWESFDAGLSDRDRVRSDLKDTYPGILKEKEFNLNLIASSLAKNGPGY